MQHELLQQRDVTREPGFLFGLLGEIIPKEDSLGGRGGGGNSEGHVVWGKTVMRQWFVHFLII